MRAGWLATLAVTCMAMAACTTTPDAGSRTSTSVSSVPGVAPSSPPAATARAMPAEVVARPEPELAPPPAPEIAAVTVTTPPPGVDTSPPSGDEYVADYCVPRDWLTPHHEYSDYARTVVDPTYAVPADYQPPDLVPASEAGFGGDAAAVLVRALLVDDLTAVRTAAEAAGAPLEVLSGYRSHDQQAATFDHWAARLGFDEAVRRAARPGHSEHQLGTSIDFSSPGWTDRFGDWAVESASGAWLAVHAWEYGFVMSYPNGGDLATCYGYEPWHFRWIGRDAARAWQASGVTLHEFLVAAGEGLD